MWPRYLDAALRWGAGHVHCLMSVTGLEREPTEDLRVVLPLQALLQGLESVCAGREVRRGCLMCAVGRELPVERDTPCRRHVPS